MTREAPASRDRPRRRVPVGLVLAVALVVAAAACSSGSPADDASPALATGPAGETSTPVVVASTALVGALVRSVAGDQVDLRVLVPPGTDPTTATVDDTDPALADADLVVVIDPATYERGLAPPLATATVEVLSLAPQLNPIPLGGSELAPGSTAPGGATDPHVWLDPDRWTQAGRLVADAVSRLDGVDPTAVAANAAAFGESVSRSDETVQATFAVVPEGRRVLVGDLPGLGYLADRYGFDLVLVTDATGAAAAAGTHGAAAVFTDPARLGSLTATLTTAAPPLRVVALDLDAAGAPTPTDLAGATATYVELLVGTADAIASGVAG